MRWIFLWIHYWRMKKFVKYRLRQNIKMLEQHPEVNPEFIKKLKSKI
jgi:hypothetical protein